jgi:uncharacterized membrane protein
MRSMLSAIVRFFLTGAATLLPLAVTVFVVSWIVKFADGYIGPSSSFGLFLVRIVGPEYRYPGYIVGYLVATFLVILLGFLVTRATISKLRSEVNGMVARIPLIGKLYAAVVQFVEIFDKKGQGPLERFGGVGEVRMGNVKMLVFLTSPERYPLMDGKEYLLVFVANSPIPATGFNMLVPVEDVRRLDMPVEDLVKLLMSLGLLGPQVLPGPLFGTQLNGAADERDPSA